MTVKTFDIIRWIFTFAFLLFHCSVTYFIFHMKVIKKNSFYTSSFYLLYLMISLADITTIINNFLSQKLILINALKPWFYDHSEYDTILTLISGYLIYFQCLLHASISINRVWTSFALIVKNYSLPKWGARFIWILPLLPFAILSVRFAGHNVYYYTAEGELASMYRETYVAIYHSIAGPSVVLSTSAISFILSIITILRYQYLFKQYKTISSTIKQDMLLFSQAFIVLIFQLALASYYIMRLIATAKNLPELQAFALLCFGYITDISSLCNPVILFILCKFIRNDYVNFYYFKKNSISTTVSVLHNSGTYQQQPQRPQTAIKL